MDAQKYWFSSGVAKSDADLGYPIEYSLRFTDDRNTLLVRENFEGGTGDWTCSCWIKVPKMGTDYNLGEAHFQYSGTGSTYTNDRCWQGSFWNTNLLSYRNPSGVQQPPDSSNQRADGLGWMNVVTTKQGGVCRSYINGKIYGDEAGVNFDYFLGGSNPAFVIGREGDETTFSGGDFYLAEYYFIDGSILDPTAFGRINKDGQWVPIKVDISQTADSQNYSGNLFASSTNNPPDFSYTQVYDRQYAKSAFDGKVNTYSHGNTPNNGAQVWKVEPPIENVTGIRFYASTFQPTFWINETEQPTSSYDLPEPNHGQAYDGPALTLASLAMTSGNSGNAPGWAAIELRIGTGDYYIVQDGNRYSDDLYADNTEQIPCPFDTTLKEFDVGGSGHDGTQAFDGDNGTYAATTQAGSWIVFRPSTPLTVKNNVKFQSNFGVVDAYVNPDNRIDISGSQEVFDVNFTGELTHICVRGVPSSSGSASVASLTYIEIDGVTLIDGNNFNYGPGGFYLDFSDPNDIGFDRSGNGNNFLSRGHDFTPVGMWSKDLYTQPKTDTPDFNSTLKSFGNPATSGFDGSLITEATASSLPNDGNWLIWRPSKQVIATNNLKVRSLFPEGVWINGTLVPNTKDLSGGYVTLDLSSELTFPLEIETLAVRGGVGTSEARFNAIIVDNVIYEDSDGNTYDHFTDTPTNNFALGNPFQLSPGATEPYTVFRNGATQLSAADTGAYFAATSAYFEPTDTNTYYWEVTVDSTPTGEYPTVVLLPDPIEDPATWYDNAFYWSYDSGNAQYNGLTVATWGTAQQGETVRMWFNCPTRTLYGQVGEGTINYYTLGDYCYNVRFMLPQQDDAVVTVNFGQRPFVYNQVPETRRYCTAELPPAAIPSGSLGFRTLTGAGGSIASVAKGEANGDYGRTGFQRGMWWLKDYATGGGANNTRHQIIDSLNTTVKPFPGDTARVSPFDAPGQSVAWCWKADEDWSGGIRHQRAGFSIVRYTGDGTTNRQVVHGLDKKPGFIIHTHPDSGDIMTWHTSMPDGYNVPLNTAEQQNSTFGAGVIKNVTDTTFNPGVGDAGVSGVNAAGVEYTCYVWADVPGYSKSGSFYGNNNENGQWVHCGFKPAMIMIRSPEAGDGYWIFDTSKEIKNRIGRVNMTNSANADGTAFSERDIVVSSKGFKLRTSSATANRNGTMYYVAFAEAPWGGSNVAPATSTLDGPPDFEGISPGSTRSLRFRGSQYLRALDDPNSTNPSISTTSFWMKVAETEVPGSGAGMDLVRFGGSQYAGFLDFSLGGNSYTNQLSLVTYDVSAGGVRGYTATDGHYRDPSAWYHVVMVRDDVNEVEPDMVKFYINGVRQEISYSGINMGVGLYSNNGYRMSVGGEYANPFKGYLMDLHHVDGQALLPSVFGETNANGQWVPKSEIDISDYGTHGCRLVFDPAYISGNTLRDQSNSMNDFEMSGFEIGDFYSFDFDLMKDGPTQNFATLNPLYKHSGSIDGANLQYTAPVSDGVAGNTFSFNTSNSESWYVEFTHDLQNRSALGVANSDGQFFDGIDPRTQNTPCVVYDSNGPIWINGSEQAPQTPWNAGTTISMRFDSTTRNLIFANNGTDQTGVIATLPEDAECTIICGDMTGVGGGSEFYFNAGQQPFNYPVPEGFKAFQTQNLPEATILNGKDYMNTIAYDGPLSSSAATGVSANITGLSFTPDLVWIKNRTNANYHMLFDSQRGVNATGDGGLASNAVDAATNNLNGGVSAFNPDGFTVVAGSDVGGKSNLTGSDAYTYAAWCFKMDPAAGFDIQTYTGNGAVQEVGHNLGKAPELMIVKDNDDSSNWAVFNSIYGSGGYLQLNDTDGSLSDSNIWNNTAPTDALFTVGNANTTNHPGHEFVAYLWTSIPGYSKIGEYIGNGDANGPFIPTGFTPQFVLIKRANGTGSWTINDNVRDINNPGGRSLSPDQTNVENGPDQFTYIDFLSNGFKIRTTQASRNVSGASYIYLAIGEKPFSISNAR